MADYTFTTQTVEDEIVRRLGQDPDTTILDDDNENRIMPLFWQSITDMIIAGNFKEEDIAGLITESEQTITGPLNKICSIDLSSIDNLLRYYDVYPKPGGTGHLTKIIKPKTLEFMKQILGGDPRQDGEVYLYKVGNTLYFFKDITNDVKDKKANVVYVKSPNPISIASTTISAFADGGGGTVIATTSTAHGFSTGDNINISGTINYNGTFEITVVNTTSFTFTDTWVADDAIGEARLSLLSIYSLGFIYKAIDIVVQKIKENRK